MALGSSYSNNNNNNKKDISPEVYSAITFKNPEAECDPSQLSFSFWKCMLKLSISPMIQNSDSQYPQYDHDNQGTAFLTHDRARILYAEITEFLKDRNAYNNMGVPSGATKLVSISNGKEFGVNSPILVIREINAETGAVESSYMYQFGKNYRSIRNFNETDQSYDESFYEDLEIYAFLDMLEEFYKGASLARAYTVLHANRFNDVKINNKLDMLMDAAGIERSTPNKAFNGPAKSFFALGKSGQESAETGISKAPTEQTTIDELAKMIE